MSGFRATVRADLEAYARSEGRTVTLPLVFRMIFLVAGFQFVLARRIQEVLHRIPIAGRALRRIWWWMTCRSFSSEIAIGATIGKGLYIPHPYGIIVGASIVGCNVTLMQNVTIGQKSMSEGGGPVIGDGAYLSAGAVVVGNISIGTGASIGANAVVLKSVPDRALAVGVPARIVGEQAS